jgi:hypothetical protein
MDVSAALVAHPQPTAVFGARSGQDWRDVARPRFLAMPPRVIGSVGVQPLGPAAGRLR